MNDCSYVLTMEVEADTLRRLIRDEVGRCYEGDLEARVEALEGLASSVATAHEADLASLRTLGDDTRHRLVRLLAASAEERCVCELTPLVEVSASAVSHALSDLVAAGLVARRKEGSWRYYRATERAEALLAALDRTTGAPA